MNPQPSRVLGERATSSSSYSDMAYDQTTPTRLEAGSNEINSLDDEAPAHEPNERTSLLAASSSSNQGIKVAPRFDNSRAASLRGSEIDPDEARKPKSQRKRRKPWVLKLDFFVACVLLYANVSFLCLSIASIQSPFIANNALPAHRGSTFIPIWATFAGALSNILTLLAFVYPDQAPKLSAFTFFSSSLCGVIILILTMAITTLRRHEGILTVVCLALAIVSTLHAAGSALLTAKYAPLLLPKSSEEIVAESENFSLRRSLKRGLQGGWAFLHVSLPLLILHILVFAVFVLLTLSVFIRTLDASVVQPGQRWKVRPSVWARREFPELDSSVWSAGGRDFSVHLACRGVGIDDPVPPFAPNQFNTTDSPGGGRNVVRRTVLIEADQGIAGAVAANWVLKMLKEGELTSGDYETRVCYWDRPGMGYSDTSPSSTLPQVVSALAQALQISGEMARLEPPPSFASAANDSFAPTPLARSGFVLVSQGYGALPSLLFSTLNPRLVHSFLFLSPLPPALHFRNEHGFFHSIPNFFTRTIPAITTELGIWSIASLVTGHSRKSRVLSSERDGIKGETARTWVQEEGERDRGKKSLSWISWHRKSGRKPDRHAIILGGPKTAKRYTNGEWDAAQQAFVDDVVTKGALVRWEKDWPGTCEGEGEKSCRKALKTLFVD